MKNIIRIVTLGLILGAVACNVPVEKPTVVPTQAPPQPTLPVQVVENTTVAPLPTAEQTMAVAVELTETDACKLYTSEEASLLLGETVKPQAVDSPGYSFCTYFAPDGKSILISVTIGDQAKKNFLNEIGQYQKGCNVSYSGGTSAPTPFPPEIEAMMSKSVLDLYTMDMEFQKKCGGIVKPLPEFGPNANLIPNFLGIASIGIISGENYYTFSYGGQKMEFSLMEEKTREIVQSALAK